MDVFIEHMVKKKRELKDIILAFFAVAAAIVLVFFVSIFLLAIPSLGAFLMLLIVGILYLLYVLVTSINLEYEYILTNGEFDIDKIVNVRKRKRITSFDIKEVEIFSNKSNPAFEKSFKDREIKKIYACRDKREDDVYFTIYNENNQRKMLLFNPNTKMLDIIKAMNPQKVFINE